MEASDNTGEPARDETNAQDAGEIDMVQRAVKVKNAAKCKGRCEEELSHITKKPRTDRDSYLVDFSYHQAEEYKEKDEEIVVTCSIRKNIQAHTNVMLQKIANILRVNITTPNESQ